MAQLAWTTVVAECFLFWIAQYIATQPFAAQPISTSTFLHSALLQQQ
jgi:hypothetical protein